MKIHIYFYSLYKIYFFFYFKIKNILKIYIIIKKKNIEYFKLKNNLFYKYLRNNVIFLIHNCKILNIIHSIKHFLKINHNSILEKKINDIF